LITLWLLAVAVEVLMWVAVLGLVDLELALHFL
jgi:hypothetical protein